MSDSIAILKSCGAFLLDEQSVRNVEDDEPMACIALDIAQRDKIVAEIEQIVKERDLALAEAKHDADYWCGVAGNFRQERDDARAEIERLRAALKPFGLNPRAVSLSAALGHITREDLLKARDALNVSQQSTLGK